MSKEGGSEERVEEKNRFFCTGASGRDLPTLSLNVGKSLSQEGAPKWW